MTTELNAFLHGVTFAGFFVCCLFFFRFYRKTHDGLFLAFGVAFLVFALERAVMLFAERGAGREPFYLIRLGGFALIIIALALKNRADRR